MRTTNIWRHGLLLAAGLGAGVSANAQALTVTVSAPSHDYHEVPVSLVVPAESVPAPGLPPTDATPCQAEPAGEGKVRLTWIVRDLGRGEKRTYKLVPGKGGPGAGVELKQNGANVDFLVGGNLFTRYDTTTGPNKPYFYPVNAPGGKQIVRRWPVEKAEGETQDHPHHRGLWFTHGEMNGVDFWLEGPKGGRTVHTAYERVESGPIYGRMRARTDWLTPDGKKKIAEDTRDVRVYAVQDGYLMDFEIAVKAVGGPLLWGDTKEGTFALRVADSLRASAGKGKAGEGHIVNSAGDKEAATWGKAAAWCDYYGPVDGQTVGVAIFDHPQNLRHPTTWHVRDYGLFAVNPFGLHDFDPAKKENPNAGDHTTPEGQATTFRYRLFFHKGATDEARIPAAWDAYAQPPAAQLAAAQAGAGEWRDLFDGTSLAGWERKAVHGGGGGLWEVQNGVLVGNQEPDHKGGLLGTLRKYGDCEIEMEFQADYPVDSGLFLRTAENGNGYQVRIDHRAEGSIGDIYASGVGGAVGPSADWQGKYKKGEWNKLRAVIAGQPPRIQTWLNGQPAVDFQDTRERLPREGYIGLQVHGGGGSWGEDCRIRFRNVRIRSLPAPGKKG